MTRSSSAADTVQAHVLITGQVQGVGYRFSTVAKARSLGLRGWVRNLADGRVEARLEGQKAHVDQMLNWCNIGPTAAIVQDVAITYEAPQGFTSFEVHH